MSSPPTETASLLTTAERRRVDRRTVARVADLSLPEFRRLALTTIVAAAALGAFLWMVRSVLVAGIMGMVTAAYMQPLYERILGVVRRPALAAILALAAVIAPLAALLVYSYVEIVDVAQYLAAHQDEVARRIDDSLHKLIFLGGVDTSASVRRAVLAASNYGAALPVALRRAIAHFAIAATIFLFTTAYIFTDGSRVAAYIRHRIPPRYQELSASLERNVRGVLHGVVYGTLLTQALKSAVIFLMNALFGVPLAGVLAIVSFVIGFFPIVGSWSIYVPVAAWLLIFRDAPVQAAAMVMIGLVVNTLFISMFLRPKLAADRSKVLNFYWMFVGLITGVYTFGLAGIVLGPMLIGLLKAVIDTVTASSSWRFLELDDAALVETAP